MIEVYLSRMYKTCDGESKKRNLLKSALKGIYNNV